MILQLVVVVLPVFLLVASGYAAVVSRLFTVELADGLMVFAQRFAVPCLLFLAVMRLDLGQNFDWRLLLSFYSGATISFFLGLIGARKLFRRSPGESVAVAFGALFSNSLLLGVPITERAYGTDALDPNFAILSIHAIYCYSLGILLMEISRAGGRGVVGTGRAIVREFRRNTMMIGLGLGLFVNVTGLPIAEPVVSAVEMISRAALPGALFAIGGVLTRYPLKLGRMGEVAMISVLSLLVHPLITYLLVHDVFDLSQGFVRSAVVTAAMAPGVNAFVFANMYGRAKDTAATGVLVATALSVFTASAWLWILE